jgi:DNA-binding CsgD family transcriptional regulator
LRARPARPAGLTARGIDLLGLLASGLSNKEIARRLVVSPRTVGHHVAHIFAKIGVSTRSAATLVALHHGLLGER